MRTLGTQLLTNMNIICMCGWLAVCMDDLSEIEFAKKFGVSTDWMYAFSLGDVWMFDVYADFEIAYTIFVANDESSNRKHKTSYRSSLVWKPNNFISKTIIKKKVNRNGPPPSPPHLLSLARSLVWQRSGVFLFGFYISQFHLCLLMLLLSVYLNVACALNMQISMHNNRMLMRVSKHAYKNRLP